MRITGFSLPWSRQTTTGRRWTESSLRGGRSPAPLWRWRRVWRGDLCKRWDGVRFSLLLRVDPVCHRPTPAIKSPFNFWSREAEPRSVGGGASVSRGRRRSRNEDFGPEDEGSALFNLLPTRSLDGGASRLQTRPPHPLLPGEFPWKRT